VGLRGVRTVHPVYLQDVLTGLPASRCGPIVLRELENLLRIRSWELPRRPTGLPDSS
jgi:hypothetical protein